MARIICDSVAPSRCRLTTWELRLPKCLLAEFNTHRMLSRNAASSRAMPVVRVMDQIREDPYIPTWGKNQPGMQSYQPLSLLEQEAAKGKWLVARDFCLRIADQLAGPEWWWHPELGFYEIPVGGVPGVPDQGARKTIILEDGEVTSTSMHEVAASSQLKLHKQFTNRLLEAWMYADVVVSATDVQNLFHLRDHHMAHPDLAREIGKMRALFRESTPRALAAGELHLPYAVAADREYLQEEQLAFSTARCARVSLENQDGVVSRADDLKLYDRLLNPDPNDPDSPIHSSPTEHPAMALARPIRSGNFVGFVQHRKTITGECRPEPIWSWEHPGASEGLRGEGFVER